MAVIEYCARGARYESGRITREGGREDGERETKKEKEKGRDSSPCNKRNARARRRYDGLAADYDRGRTVIAQCRTRRTRSEPSLYECGDLGMRARRANERLRARARLKPISRPGIAVIIAGDVTIRSVTFGIGRQDRSGPSSRCHRRR